ncbi:MULTISPECIES: c-type cytochrome [unclassified Mesorhizobium]|uniref:c-type cytochrome n=1 Tax=unclassified Mesorhizobium TaxID=325217 RepID=UPI001129FFA1|nr:MULTISPECIES: c-type cytochrome [unclassified Mesorhizobium]TPJ40978.1 cytochrome c4 [Mesorhizobium sp. B2-6-6]MCA0008687.1 cytochrome c4 [Mesorhizobium sp. B264B1B]MCA0019435.1 cytochrome c4 [Mesorhizobium sp. B264B1A]MCA0024524.1 cytochrome c4 [Mesorhizobium sp. B263B1A]MCA0055804.1 cytochrome c4 [Mesorhizobium sp. B261B1A]
MSTERLFSATNPWVRLSIGITAALVVLTALGGFILLPYAQSDLKLAGLWDAICSAAGIPKLTSGARTVQPTFKTSDVIMTSAMLANPSNESINRGATLAQQCAICHGPTGVSRADSPNLAGQYPAAIYKQLKDFKSGARVNAVMSPFAPHLADQDMIDLAAYYNYLPRLPAYHPSQKVPAPRIVINGAPMRGIAPCGSCHGSLDNKAGSPWLEGQSAVYIKAQLRAFADGGRRNDISQQMRNIARAMTDDEMEQVAQYYASQPPDKYKPQP